MSDIALRWDPVALIADLAIEANDLAADAGLKTSVLLSLFTDRRAQDGDELPTSETDRRGWWADAFPTAPGDEIGSRLWLLDREKQTPAVLARAEEYTREALQWLLDDRVASGVDVTAEFPRPRMLGLEIVIHRPEQDPVTYRFNQAWSGEDVITVSEGSHLTYQQPPALPAPTIASLSVATGPAAGGTQLSITGTGFLPGAVVFFGGVQATVVSLSSTSIVVNTPAHASGAVAVAVTNPDRQSATLAAAYTYAPAITVPDPTITGVDVLAADHIVVRGTAEPGTTVSVGVEVATSTTPDSVLIGSVGTFSIDWPAFDAPAGPHTAWAAAELNGTWSPGTSPGSSYDFVTEPTVVGAFPGNRFVRFIGSGGGEQFGLYGAHLGNVHRATITNDAAGLVNETDLQVLGAADGGYIDDNATTLLVGLPAGLTTPLGPAYLWWYGSDGRKLGPVAVTLADHVLGEQANNGSWAAISWFDSSPGGAYQDSALVVQSSSLPAGYSQWPAQSWYQAGGTVYLVAKYPGAASATQAALVRRIGPGTPATPDDPGVTILATPTPTPAPALDGGSPDLILLSSSEVSAIGANLATLFLKIAGSWREVTDLRLYYAT